MCIRDSLEVMRPGKPLRRGQVHGRDQLSGLEHIFLHRILAVGHVEILQRNRALTARAAEADYGVERYHRNIHVGGMRGDAALAGSEHRMGAVESLSLIHI